MYHHCLLVQRTVVSNIYLTSIDPVFMKLRESPQSTNVDKQKVVIYFSRMQWALLDSQSYIKPRCKRSSSKKPTIVRGLIHMIHQGLARLLFCESSCVSEGSACDLTRSNNSQTRGIDQDLLPPSLLKQVRKQSISFIYIQVQETIQVPIDKSSHELY